MGTHQAIWWPSFSFETKVSDENSVTPAGDVSGWDPLGLAREGNSSMKVRWSSRWIRVGGTPRSLDFCLQ